jgi:hypothetical protein
MLKNRPKQFWGMLKAKTASQTDIPTAEFIQFNREIFYDDTIPPDEYTPVPNAATHHITTAELTTTLTHHFKEDKSSGLSKMPLQLLKHLGPAGIHCVADLLNHSAIDQLPPLAWRTSKITPLYKGKGNAQLPENYRSIAVAPPLSKLFMSVINRRLTTTAEELNLYAPTQAGFRAHHSTVEQALILQTLIQHSIRSKR